MQSRSVRRLLPLLLCVPFTLAADAPTPSTQPTTQPVQWLGDATRVTLSLKDASPYDAFKALEDASGIALVLPSKEQSDRRVTLDSNNSTWMQTAVEIADKANVRLSYFGGRWNLALGGEPRVTPRRYFVGPLLATANRVSIDREVRYGTPTQTVQTVTLTGSILAEPRIQSLQVDGPCDFIEGMDDQGRPLQPVTTDRPNPAPQSRMAMYAPGERRDFSVTMQLPNADAESIRTLKAMAHIGVLSKTESLQFTDILNSEGATAVVGDAKFTVERIDPMGQNYSVVLRVDANSMPNSFLLGARSNQPPFQPKIGPNSASIATDVRVTNSSVREGALSVTLTFVMNAPRTREGDAPDDAENAAKPVINLTWPLPLAYQRVDVPIEFSDIPLPK